MPPRSALPSLVAFLALTIPSHASAARSARITGTATYRERVSLTRDAVFDAELVEVSRAGARGEVIANVHKANPGQVPIAFEIRYNAGRINAHHTYMVRATIHEGDQLRFISDGTYPVLARGHGSKVAILMRAAPGGGEHANASGLENNRWRPVQIGDKVVKLADNQPEPWIKLDPHAGRVTGSGGCNRIIGTYVVSDGTLRFRPLAVTQKACLSMTTEHTFLRALRATRRYRLRARVLELLDANGKFLVRLEERNLY